VTVAPLVIHQVAAGAGTLAMSHCPGRGQLASNGQRQARDLAADLAAIRATGATHLLSLVQPVEYAVLGVPDFARAVAASGLAWWQVPIADMLTPDAETLAAWREVAPPLRAALRAGRRVHVHCAAGLGRTGMLVARLLVEEGGLAPEAAIAKVRTARPGTIETEGQARFVHAGWPI
jgi:protein-tyrosine phosphatase